MFYTETGGQFLFASEIKALFAHPGVTHAIIELGVNDIGLAGLYNLPLPQALLLIGISVAAHCGLPSTQRMLLSGSLSHGTSS